MLIITGSSVSLTLRWLQRVVKHMHGGDGRRPGGVVQTAQPLIRDRRPRRCTPSSGFVTQTGVAIFVIARLAPPGNPSTICCQAWLSLNGPQRGAAGFPHVCLCTWEPPCVDAHFWLAVSCRVLSQSKRREAEGEEEGVVLFRVVLAVSGVAKPPRPGSPSCSLTGNATHLFVEWAGAVAEY